MVNNMQNESYGVTEKTINQSEFLNHKEELQREGYTIIHSGISNEDLDIIQNKVLECKDLYDKKYEANFLESIDESNTVRAPFLLDPIFLDICLNNRLLEFITLVMGDNFILNQQNVIINPSGNKYNQIYWHRDLPYQHFTSSRPLAINALFCLNDFTIENGCTKVLPGSHLFESFPSDNCINSTQRKIESLRGNYLVLDSMVYHAGSQNTSKFNRVGINNVFSIPLIKRQIEVREKDFDYKLSEYKKLHKEKLLNFLTPQSVTEFLNER